MDHTTISANLSCAKFLGSRNRIITAGNNPTANLQIQYSNFINGTGGKRQFQTVSDVSLSGNCTSMELCGIPRLNKTFAAVSKSDRNTSKGSISLVDVETSVSSAHLEAHDDGEYSLFDGFCPYTSLSFLPDHETLAAGSESGEIVLFDLYAGKEISRIKGDPTGVSKVKFTRSGQLVSLGKSNKAQLRIWDIKMRSGVAQVLQLSQEITSNRSSSGGSSPLNGSSSSSSGGRALQQQYTCVSPHPLRNTVMCGTAEGEVVLWDLRSTASTSMEFQPHHGKVMDILQHPDQQDLVLTCSADGTVKHFSSNNYAAANVHRGSVDGSESDFVTLLSEPAVVSALDHDIDSNTLLAVSEIGSLWRLQL